MTQLASCTFGDNEGLWATGRLVDHPKTNAWGILESLFRMLEAGSSLTLSLHDQPVENAIKVDVVFQAGDISEVREVILPQASSWPPLGHGVHIWFQHGLPEDFVGYLRKGLYLQCDNCPVRPEKKWFTRFRKLTNAWSVKRYGKNNFGRKFRNYASGCTHTSEN